MTESIDSGPIIVPDDPSHPMVVATEPNEIFSAVGDAAGILPVTPTRVLDTREGIGRPGTAPVGAHEEFTLHPQAPGLPTSGVDAIILNVTSTATSAHSFITVWPADADRPVASNLNPAPGRDTPNLVITKVAADGSIKLYNEAGSTHLVADLIGYSIAPDQYHSLQPERLLDTREGLGAPRRQLPSNGVIDLVVAGRGGVPASGADAVVLNVTVASPTANGHITVWPSGTVRPVASALNTRPGATFANLVISKVGPNGKVSLYNFGGPTDLVADVVGWLPADGAYTAINPVRVLDTRPAELTGRFGKPSGAHSLTPLGGAPVGTATTIAVDPTMLVSLPAGVTSLVLNLTAVTPSQATYVTSWAHGDTRPDTSTLNAAPGAVVPNLAVVGVDGSGWFDLYNRWGNVHLIADVVGYITATAGTPLPAATGPRVNVVHVLPSGASATYGENEIRATLAATQSFIGAQRYRSILFGTSAGQITVSTLVLPESAASLKAMNSTQMFLTIRQRLFAMGLASNGDIIMGFVDGLDLSGTCGLGALGGPGLVFTSSCGPAVLSGMRPAFGATWDNSRAARVFLHEFFHTLGAVSNCAPGGNGSGHSADTRDVMYPADVINGSTGMRYAPYNGLIDAGNDDYWGVGTKPKCNNTGWPDLAASPLLG